MNDILTGKTCAYCMQPTVLADTAEVYSGTSYGWMWMCRPCRAYVGCHNNTKVALGRVADTALRASKQAFHRVFDPLWKDEGLNRSALYKWLAERMGIDESVCHGGMFSREQCEEAIGLLLRHPSCKAPALTKEQEQMITDRAECLVHTFSDEKGTGSVLTTCEKEVCVWPECVCVTTPTT